MSHLIEVYVANGMTDANLIKMYLEANGVSVVLYPPSSSSVYPTTIGELGEIPICVAQQQVEAAKFFLARLESGEAAADGLELPPSIED